MKVHIVVTRLQQGSYSILAINASTREPLEDALVESSRRWAVRRRNQACCYWSERADRVTADGFPVETY
jgi:hypothetical protein